MWWIERVVDVLFGAAMGVTAMGYLYYGIGEHRMQGVLRKFRVIR